MTSGRATFHLAVAAEGATRCVVPSDDAGLSQEVEDCMRTRLETERFAATAGPWSAAVPVLVRDGSLALGSGSNGPAALEMIESHGLGEDIYDTVEALLPDLKSCLTSRGAGGVVRVGAKVAADGRVTCAVASGSVPDGPRACVEAALEGARFRPPKRGYGLLSLPIGVQRR